MNAEADIPIYEINEGVGEPGIDALRKDGRISGDEVLGNSVPAVARSDQDKQHAASEEPHGYFRAYKSFRSRFLDRERNVLVYLPSGYGDDRQKRYPVLYLHDGQNLFDGATSFIAGQDWHFHQTAEELVEAGEIEPLIIVGIYNTGVDRMDEYTPTRDPYYRAGGRADLYGRLIVEELKPLVDNLYRTLKNPENTGLGGSSLGGLVSLYLALKYPEVFGKVAAISPSVWWDRRSIVRMVRALKSKPDLRIWLDVGTREGERTVRNVELLRDALIGRGWVLDKDLKYHVAEGAQHTELAWAERVDKVLRFLFPTSETPVK